MAGNGEEPDALDFESSQTKLLQARAELEEARAAEKLEEITRAENVQTKLEEVRRATLLQIELEEARARLEQRVQAELEKARAARAAHLEAKQKTPSFERRAQRGARLAAHASREWTGVLEDVPESPPRKGTNGQLADEQPDNHRAFPEPARLPVPTPQAVLFKQNPSSFEAVPSIRENSPVEVQTANLERKVENSPYSAAAVFSEESPQSITADFFTPTRTPAKAKTEVVTASTVAFIDGEQSMLERFETFLNSSGRAEEVVVVGQEVVVYKAPKAEEIACIEEEDQSMCVRLESFLTTMLEQNGFSSYSPYVEGGAAVEKRTRCGCI
mmetsp:Transcript_81906/g.198793  ORF Transcript_81906/g.198793 Transcript_81906/m.198793 type:complete len:329 (+) Transcript_81906:52-1038(+)